MDIIFDKQHIKSKLKSFSSPSRISMNHIGFVNSAILFLLIPHMNASYELVLIRRTKRDDDKHSGEMGFPGGKVDPKDQNYQETAIRETEEELGIPREKIVILGSLDDHLTPKGFIISPFVGYVDENHKMIKQDDEVKEIVKIPISFFANKKNYKEKTYKIKEDLVGVGKYVYRNFKSQKYVIFGATSHIIVNYCDTVYDLGLMTPGCRRIRCEDIKDKIVK